MFLNSTLLSFLILTILLPFCHCLAAQAHNVSDEAELAHNRMADDLQRVEPRVDNPDDDDDLDGDRNREGDDRQRFSLQSNDPQGWEILFDGTSTDAWRGYNMATFPNQGWNIVGDELVFEPSDKGEWTSGLDIITKEKYGDFELELEWMVTKGANSGIFYHILEQPDEAIYWSALEMQVLDNENHPDAGMGKDGNRKAGSLYDLIPANPQNAKSYGEWNRVKIKSEGNHIEHWMNGEKVLEFERFTVEWFHMLRNSKFREHNEFGAMREGHIGLQDHGDLVKYRNIRIRRL